MKEKLNCLQFKFSIPEKLIYIPRFSVNRISRRSTVATKTRNLISQSYDSRIQRDTGSDPKEI